MAFDVIGIVYMALCNGNDYSLDHCYYSLTYPTMHAQPLSQLILHHSSQGQAIETVHERVVSLGAVFQFGLCLKVGALRVHPLCHAPTLVVTSQ